MNDIIESRLGARIKQKIADGIVVEPGDLVEVMQILRDDPALRFDILHDISGVDYLEIDPKKAAKAGFEPHLEVVYHLQSFTFKHRLTVKVMLPRVGDDGGLPSVPTLSGIFKIADWLERETYDLVGINFTGHPNLQRILLSEDWEGHPLRKDYEFPLEYHGIRGR
jgi:NADH-quinone oxidoreductase subunit C